MIDGVKYSCVGLKSEIWQQNPLLDFGVWLSETTGEIQSKRKIAKFQSLQFTISDNGNCSVSGSLHKYHNGNGTNWNDFTFADLFRALQSLNQHFNIDLQKSLIHSLEIGVNLELEYTPYIILKSIVCHKGKPFNNLNGKDKRLGLICDYTDYALKFYDKGHQSRISDNGKFVLRYEIKLHRQRMLQPYGITRLSDLQRLEKVAPLVGLLTDKLKEIIFFDFKFDGATLSKSKKIAWQQYSNPNFWAGLTNKQRHKARQRYETLLKKYNCIDWALRCINRVAKKWNELSESKQETGRQFPQLGNGNASVKKETISNLECVLESVANGDTLRTIQKENEPPPRYCISCGRQITNQKAGSRFCSEKIYGAVARQCRNKDSNRRLAIKRKIYRAMAKEKLLSVTYSDNGRTYTDILGTNEICLTREWLDKIISVGALEKEPQQTQPFTGDTAKEYLQKINNNNSKS
jgi:predicted nucleic acid-binding Zn ribbon protein